MPIKNLKKSKKKKKGNSKKRVINFGNLFNISNTNALVNYQRLEALKGIVGKEPHILPDNVRIIKNAGVVMNTNDFVFQDGSKVEVGTKYHIHVNDQTKVETYMTGEDHFVTSKTIFRMRGDTTFGEYKKLKPAKKRQIYASPFEWSITKKDTKKGFSNRYFVKEKFGRRNMFEVNENDGESKLNMYDTISIKWFISTNKQLVEELNLKELDIARQQGFELMDRVSPLSGFIGGLDTLNDRIDNMKSSTERLQSMVREQNTTPTNNTSAY